ncbi:MAG: NrdH-like redox domain-containing protein, partial [Candidatus Omnitrophica bacterium CG11_big_fil_rev_8_21_14_0_20_42_13]
KKTPQQPESMDASLESANGAIQEETIGEKKPKKEVAIYITEWCYYCKELEKLLKKNKIEYKRFDIEEDPAALEEFHRLGGRGVPLIKIGAKLINGYSPSMILKEYNSN